MSEQKPKRKRPTPRPDEPPYYSASPGDPVREYVDRKIAVYFGRSRASTRDPHSIDYRQCP